MYFYISSTQIVYHNVMLVWNAPKYKSCTFKFTFNLKLKFRFTMLTDLLL